MGKNIVIKDKISYDEIYNSFKNFSKVIVATNYDIKKIFTNLINQLGRDVQHVYYLDDFGINDALDLSKYMLINHFDCLISVGGGTVNDVCKMAAKHTNVYFISIPTIISNDGVCSNTSVLKIDGIRTDGFLSKSPDSIFVDIDVIKNSPARFLKAGICDILSNYTALWDWDLAVSKGKEKKDDIAKMISSNSFWGIMNMRENIDESLRIKLICESIILSGIAMEIKGNTRPCSGSEHLFNHAIVAYYPEIHVLHGYLVGLGSLVSSILQKQNYQKLIKYLKLNDIDVRPSTLGISIEVFIDAWMKAKETRPSRYTILNEVNLNKELLVEIYYKIEREAF